MDPIGYVVHTACNFAENTAKQVHNDAKQRQAQGEPIGGSYVDAALDRIVPVIIGGAVVAGVTLAIAAAIVVKKVISLALKILR